MVIKDSGPGTPGHPFGTGIQPNRLQEDRSGAVFDRELADRCYPRTSRRNRIGADRLNRTIDRLVIEAAFLRKRFNLGCVVLVEA